MLFSQEAVTALLLQLSLPLALRDERLHLRAQSDHVLLCHRKQREEGISENPTEWIQGMGKKGSSCVSASQSTCSAGAAERR